MSKIRFFLLILLAAGALIWYKPEWLKKPEWIQTANNLKRETTQRVAQIDPLDLWQDSKAKVLGTYSNIQKENLIPGLPSEVVVDETVNQLTQQVKDLPHQQVMKVKREFCRDVINEATEAANNQVNEENE